MKPPKMSEADLKKLLARQGAPAEPKKPTKGTKAPKRPPTSRGFNVTREELEDFRLNEERVDEPGITYWRRRKGAPPPPGPGGPGDDDRAGKL